MQIQQCMNLYPVTCTLGERRVDVLAVVGGAGRIGGRGAERDVARAGPRRVSDLAFAWLLAEASVADACCPWHG